MPQAVAIAKLHDEKSKLSPSPLPFNKFSKPLPITTTSTASKTFPSLLPTPPSKLPIKHLTKVEMQACREKYLCYNCDERYTCDHHCKSQFLLLIVSDLDDVSEPPTKLDYDPPNNPSLKAGFISLHSFSGHWTPRTFWVTGSINGYEV